MSGKGGDTESKEALATKLIIDLLADGKERFSEEIEKAAAEIGIFERTIRNAKKLGDRIKSRESALSGYADSPNRQAKRQMLKTFAVCRMDFARWK